MNLIDTNNNLNYFEKIEVRGLFSFWSNLQKVSLKNGTKPYCLQRPSISDASD